MREFATEAYVKRVNSEPPPRLSGFLGQISAVTTHDVSADKMRKIKDSGVPIMIGTGTDDHLVDYRNSEHLAEVLQPAEFVTWEGAGHGVPMEKFKDFNAAILRNLERGRAH
eukprot:TRINITY_DN2116_c0_g1_i2.p2 TRINITY_DN2116_c0_g1~~TRINITY_DN2116_c0_g1_i2.p2  ORF type:complete len:112 (+),score=20.59 TRINITY_DN2116_c0_g1_i2:631-966(+)